VDLISGTHATILDTRKTTPGLRALEKYAVKMGGGENHRFALWDMYLVKDNHIRAAGGVTAAIERFAGRELVLDLSHDRVAVLLGRFECLVEPNSVTLAFEQGSQFLSLEAIGAGI
jgi:nicotinate-nucleotide pyrophosphorylase (carboxylating)